MNLIKNRKWWYLLSLLVILPGTLSLVFWGLKPSIDFTGGAEIEFSGISDRGKLESIAIESGFSDFSISSSGDSLVLRTKSVDSEKEQKIITNVESSVSGAKKTRVDTVGPSISKEITRNAFILTAAACLVIIFYIALMFRKIPKPASSWEFGTIAVLALLHDALVVLGSFSLLGHFYNIEIDPLFITAILTIIGFSVHDTIVIFDRIRENLLKGSYANFESTVSVSVYEMLPRTLSTSFLVWVILLILYLFGGDSVRYFVLALVIGVFSGTYSSILVASPLLVTWENLKAKGILKKKQ